MQTNGPRGCDPQAGQFVSNRAAARASAEPCASEPVRPRRRLADADDCTRAPGIGPLSPDQALVRRTPHDRAGIGLPARAALLVAALGGGFVVGWSWYDRLDADREARSKHAIASVVTRIVAAESNGCADAKNKRSTATGAGQFIDETWLRLIRTHRPDLAARSEKEVLDLRRDSGLAREITTRFAEQNAAKLHQRRLPVTAASLYLSHFAGSAGAVAILSAPDSADAAAVMAKADSTGRITRDKIVYANPFLGGFTIADLKGWADRKMSATYVSTDCGRSRQRVATSG